MLSKHDPCCRVLGPTVFCVFQGAQALVQVFCLNLLNEAGRTAVSSVIRQRGTLYPPATDPLKDICSNYSSLRGCDKWLLGSILLLVFRCVLHDATSLVTYVDLALPSLPKRALKSCSDSSFKVDSRCSAKARIDVYVPHPMEVVFLPPCMAARLLLPQERYVKAPELSALIDTWGGEQAVLLQLRKLLQVASALTFAVRAPSFDENERKQLAKHARDTVSCICAGVGGVVDIILGRYTT